MFDNVQKILTARILTVLALSVPVFFAMMWASSALIDGLWRFGEESLSRLGVSEDPVAALLFNGGCISTGAMGIIVGLGIAAHNEDFGSLAGITYAAGMFFLVLVGALPLTAGMIHYVVASIFGILMMISLILTAIHDHRRRMHPEAEILFIVISLVLIATQRFAMWEALLVIIVMIWTVLQGIKMRVYSGTTE